MRRVVPFVCGKAVALRVVVGRGAPQMGAHTRLAIRVADVARELGFDRVAIRSSKFTVSNSRYVSATDRAGRVWDIRIANHQRPERASIPHLDLISVDGEAGFDDARDFLCLVAAGEVPWFDGWAGASTVPAKVRRRIERCK